MNIKRNQKLLKESNVALSSVLDKHFLATQTKLELQVNRMANVVKTLKDESDQRPSPQEEKEALDDIQALESKQTELQKEAADVKKRLDTAREADAILNSTIT